MGIYSSVMETVTEVTGLSPTAFFTILAMMVVVYNIVSGMFLGPEDFREKPQKEPIQLGDITESELRAYDGSDPKKPLLIAIKGQIYDVSSSEMFYGRGGAYSMFTGRDASRALAMLSFKPEDLTGNLDGLSAEELGVLEDWECKFIEKYPVVGRVVPAPKSSENGDGVHIQDNDRNGQQQQVG
ncbi:ARABIDOPSIS THALIANA MEMBRANE-ASSOCIATED PROGESTERONE BINDING PROTEIN 3 [Hibiscus trionum]|uniref:ARABIDOPSIS THALIANA MEMBRANE-ASSOCIATED PROGESTERONE BINDING PROTEIN 3 n=1 Tax=Hibiscus trionum TaxID=183268 RepID=A0A9W7LNS2_HIBTR|nr:ARABIDOPSIS THALIANA MEMBRANE-ASSOCIATED PROGESTERONE BINDING PROTEIN 3 [Hibiscus trionum]